MEQISNVFGAPGENNINQPVSNIQRIQIHQLLSSKIDPQNITIFNRNQNTDNVVQVRQNIGGHKVKNMVKMT